VIVQTKIIYSFYVVLSVMLGVLAKEYYHTKMLQQQLYALQDEYQQYLSYYKQGALKQAQDTEFFFSQKNNNEEFLAVNRESTYLKESAMQFAQEHNMRSAMEQLYDGSVVPAVRSARSSKKKSVAKKYVPVKGNGLLAWPLERGAFWISSRFGPRRKKDGSKGFHYGVDLAAPKGTLVHAALKGTVIRADCSKEGYGNCIVVDHPHERMTTRYAHLDRVLAKVGDVVNAGAVIGRVGNTGSVRGRNGKASATHLHFEVALMGKKRIDPLLLLT
jgi:murein DD-endopeptidase MepM/ murein hydrolase activator NlpD